MRTWTAAGGSLEVDRETVTLVSASGVLRASSDELRSGKLDGTICSAFDVETLAEARAVLQLANAAPAAGSTPVAGGCGCSKSPSTPEEHGSIESLSWATDPNAPVEVRASVGRCTVCGGLWTFSLSGDSHYGYSSRARRFQP